VLVSALALLLVPGRLFGARARTALVLAAGLVATAVGSAAAAGLFGPLRLFSVLGSGATDLSNRDMIWPVFAEAWRLSPVWGLGLGAGKIVLPPESLLAHLVGTTAAHNEYLRMLVEGGVAGLVLLIVLFVGWVWTRTRALSLPDRIFMRLVFLGFAIHCYTDNVLIATSSSVFFTWVSAVFARSGEAR
jgi:O-antigen ligase